MSHWFKFKTKVVESHRWYVKYAGLGQQNKFGAHVYVVWGPNKGSHSSHHFRQFKVLLVFNNKKTNFYGFFLKKEKYLELPESFFHPQHFV
jgi:hypothetical protein